MKAQTARWISLSEACTCGGGSPNFHIGPRHLQRRDQEIHRASTCRRDLLPPIRWAHYSYWPPLQLFNVRSALASRTLESLQSTVPATESASTEFRRRLGSFGTA